jgi:serine/threonine-protein phosphatase 2B catalytic subunit
VLKDKVIAVTKMMKMYKVLREENELVLQLKQLSHNQKIPAGLLSEGRDGIQKAIASFKSIQETDKSNEGRPFEDEDEEKTLKLRKKSSGFRTTGMKLTKSDSKVKIEIKHDSIN